MKRLNRFFYLLLLSAAFAACSDDDGPKTPPVEYDVISFEPAEGMLDAVTGQEVKLGEVKMSLMGLGDYTYPKVYCAKAYATTADFDGKLFTSADRNMAFYSYYASAYDGWGGIGLSQMYDMNAATATSKQQFSVWADGGANGTDTFAVCYDSNSPTEMYPEYLSKSGYPTIDMTEPRIVDHLYIANSTWIYNYFTGNDSDSFQVRITGSLDGVEKGCITETLVAGKSKLSGWRKVDLSSFGAIDKLVFKVICNYLADPTYFCIDEIALVKQTK